jgi:hypothetical protein
MPGTTWSSAIAGANLFQTCSSRRSSKLSIFSPKPQPVGVVWSVLLQERRLTRWAFFRSSKVQRSAQCSQSL